MNLTTNMWDKTTNALGKTHVWKNKLAKKAKNNNAKLKSRPSTMCIIVKKGRQQKKKLFEVWDKIPKP